MKNIRFKSVALLLAALALGSSLAPSSASAARTPLSKLLESPTRPTMLEVIRAYEGKLPESNPYKKYLGDEAGYEQRMQDLSRLPKVIAFMEKAFPGAIWAPLGRDAVIFGDLLDAFYLSIGQKGRVSRLNASGASFNGDSGRVKLLESAGFDFAHAKESMPFVGLDRTGYGPGSQSTTLIAAGYAAYAKRGGDPKDLLHKLNFMGLSGGSAGEGLNQKMLDQYFENISLTGGHRGSLADIMQLSVGSWTDSNPWHDTFGSISRQDNGKVEGTPGALSPIEARKAILGEMLEILRRVANPKFFEAVKAEANKLKYEFPVKNEDFARIMEEREKARALEEERRQKELERRIQDFPGEMQASFAKMASEMAARPAEAQKTYLTEGAAQASEWLDAELQKYKEIKKLAPAAFGENFSSDRITLHFIAEITVLRGASKISSRDYRRLLARAFSATKKVRPEFLKAMDALYQKEPILKAALNEKAEFFMTTEREGAEHTKAVYKKIRGEVMKLSPWAAAEDCEDVFADDQNDDKKAG